MNHNTISTSRAAIGAAALALIVAGCASTGPSRSAKTVDTMDDTHKELSKVRQQIDQTLVSLDGVMRASPAELQASFKRYSKDVDELKSDARKTARRFEDMKSMKAKYLAAWEKERSQVEDPELRRIGEQRRSAAKVNLERVVDSLNVANEAFDPFLKNLTDVQTILGNDLTATGQGLVGGSSVVQNANTHGARVAENIDVARAALSEVAGQISSTGAMIN